MAKNVVIDWTPAPTDAELVVVSGRLTVSAADWRLEQFPRRQGEGTLPPGAWALDVEELVIRESFVYRPEAAPACSSDRAVPPREERPGVTRLVAAHGASLRFYLSGMGVRQAAGGVGEKFVKPYAIKSASGGSEVVQFPGQRRRHEDRGRDRDASNGRGQEG